MKELKPDIFQYLEYRLFLRDVEQYVKTKKSLSSRKWCQQLGLSPSLLSLILSGKRNLTIDILNLISDNIKLSDSQIKYFQWLIIYNDTKNSDQRIEALQHMKRLKGFREASKSEFETFEYLTRWIYVVIREATFLNDIKWNAIWLQNQLWPKLGIQEIQRAMDYLIKKKYVILENERPKAVELQLNCDNDIYRLSLAQFHSQMFQRGIESIEYVNRDRRMILGHTLACSAEAKKQIDELIIETQKKIRIIEQSDQGIKNEVYHVGLASFPLTKPTTERN